MMLGSDSIKELSNQHSYENLLQLNNVVLISFTDAFCPEHISAVDWVYYDFANSIYNNDQERLPINLEPPIHFQRKAYFQPINFNIALTGNDYAASDSTYSATTVPTFSNWSEWGSCAPDCGPGSIRSRTRSCNTQYCPGAIEESEACTVGACTTDKHECIADDQGTKWRPIILQYRENGGIPANLYNCFSQAGFSIDVSFSMIKASI